MQSWGLLGANPGPELPGTNEGPDSWLVTLRRVRGIVPALEQVRALNAVTCDAHFRCVLCERLRSSWSLGLKNVPLGGFAATRPT